MNLDIEFPRMPCDILGLDVEDILGTHKTDVMGELFKKRLDSNGKVLSTESAHDKEESRSKIRDRARDELNAKQGCRFTGFIKVYRVPGDFHIASHTFDDIIFSLRNEGFHFDYSYKINHVSFGKKKDHDYIKRHYTDLYLEHPADGISGKPDYITKNNTKTGTEEIIPKGIRTIFQFVAVPSYFKSRMST